MITLTVKYSSSSSRPNPVKINPSMAIFDVFSLLRALLTCRSQSKISVTESPLTLRAILCQLKFNYEFSCMKNLQNFFAYFKSLVDIPGKLIKFSPNGFPSVS